MKALLPLSIFLLTADPAWAGDYRVFGIRNDFPMSDGQALFRDVYVNMGTRQGIKKGSLLEASRVVTSIDELNRKSGPNISFRIARLKVIHADTEISVARVVETLPLESTPLGSYSGVIVGDEVDVARK